MDSNRTVFRLQVITLLNSICVGLLYVFLSPYLILLGGDNVTIGIYAAATGLAHLVSPYVVRDIINTQGEKAALYTILNIAALSHSLLYISSSYYFTILARCIYAATNQSSVLVKNLLLENVSSDQRDFQLKTNKYLNYAGMIIGPVVAGALFDTGFPVACCLASILTIINVCILTGIRGLQDFPSEGSDELLVTRIRQYAERSIEEFKQSDYQSNWDVLSIHFLLSTSFLVFSTKYSQILKNNYHSSSVVIGFTTSYLNGVMYIGKHSLKFLGDTLAKYPLVVILNGSFTILLLSMILAIYAPIFAVYCLMCIPAFFMKILINNLWEHVMYSRGNNFLPKACLYMKIFANIVIPLVFGFVCNEIGHHAVTVFTTVPILFVLYIIHNANFCGAQLCGSFKQE